MNLLLVFVLAASMFNACDGFKFLLYMPLFGRSHVNFLGKLADTLLDAGHDVTVLMPMFDTKLGTNGTNHPRAKKIFIPQCEHLAKAQEDADREGGSIQDAWKTDNPMVMLMVWFKIKMAWVSQCRVLLENDDLIEQLKEEHFDVGFNELMDYCGGALFHRIGINKIAVAISVAMFEGGYEITGSPHMTSYVPGVAAKWGDQMTFTERFFNVFAICVFKILTPITKKPYTELFREIFSPDFPDALDIYGNTSLVFLNNEPLIEFPRPTTHKVIDIGGITVSFGHEPLNKTWSDMMDLRPQTVLLSFGTFFKSYLMPPEYKRTIRETARQFPNVTFIWKYEKPEDDVAGDVKNLIAVTWAPQNDMLYDPRLSLFITHGGQGSTTEVTTAGVPVIVIPVAADQFRNGQVLVRNGMGISLPKDAALAEVGNLGDAIRTVLGDKRYKESARRVSALIANRPFKPKEMFIRNMEFLAKFGPIRNFDHHGVKLNFFQYYSIDVIAAVFAVITVLLYVMYRTTRLLFSFVYCRIVKSKVE